MTICEDGHEQIVFEGRFCPLCRALRSLSAAEEKISDLEGVIENLETKIEGLEMNQ